MGLLLNCIKEKDRSVVPIWLTDVGDICLSLEDKKKNPNFINLCLNKNYLKKSHYNQ